MIEHIVNPSKAISDQYGSEKIVRHDGTQLIGRIGAEANGILHVMTNPFAPESVVELPINDVVKRERWPVSPMPPGLINSLNADELRDLIAYLLSGGNSGHEYFRRNDGDLIFDGETLAGWKGDEGLWSVHDGAIVGNSHSKKLKSSSYLIWEGGEVVDFHLAFDVRLEGNNSGMQYRSEVFADEPFRLRGYQADVHPQTEYTGMLYGEAIGRDIIATRGNKYVVDEQTGVARVTSALQPIEPLDLTQWHTFEIIAKRNHLIHKIDGEVVLDLTDNHREKRLRGLIGVQLHAGEGMKVWYNNIRLERF